MGRNALRDAAIIQRLPDIFRRYGDIPEGIVGSTIVNFGAFKRDGCSLVIEYIPAGKQRTRRAVLSFSDTGMYVDYASPPEEDDEPGGDIDWGDGGPFDAE